MEKIKRYIETIYCDDIRHELGGKLSFIGTYSEVMYVKNFPITLPKFCISAKFVSFSLEPIPAITVRILINDDVMDENQFPAEVPIENSEEIDPTNQETKNNLVKIGRFQYAFSPFEIKKECKIGVRILFDGDDEPLKGLPLRVKKVPES